MTELFYPDKNLYNFKNYKTLKKNIENHVDNYFTKMVKDCKINYKKKGSTIKYVRSGVDNFLNNLFK